MKAFGQRKFWNFSLFLKKKFLSEFFEFVLILLKKFLSPFIVGHLYDILIKKNLKWTKVFKKRQKNIFPQKDKYLKRKDTISLYILGGVKLC